MKTDEKTTWFGAVPMPRVRIAVLGNNSVGKSALTVRFLTRRFIGEYQSNADLLYRQTVTLNSTTIEVEIIDVSGGAEDSLAPIEAAQCADACVIVYSITDRHSFQYATEALDQLHSEQHSFPVTLLANKADLEHLREVEELEGRTIAEQTGVQFYEVSVAENSSDIYHAFGTLVNECRGVHNGSPNNYNNNNTMNNNNNNNNGKTRKFSVSKMIGTLIGNTTKNGLQSAPLQGGTVMVCQKSDLYRHNTVLKRERRHNYTATASL